MTEAVEEKSNNLGTWGFFPSAAGGFGVGRSDTSTAEATSGAGH